MKEGRVKYKISLVGEYNARIWMCPECNAGPFDNLLERIIGLSHSSVMGDVIVCECEYCFTKWYFHDKGLGCTYIRWKELR
jgi:hypothetical protein